RQCGGKVRCLPPYTSFLPLIKDEGSIVGTCDQRKKPRRQRRLVDNLLFSQLSSLVMFIVLICIIERKKLKDDPINFNVFSITIEVNIHLFISQIIFNYLIYSI
ncbi:hypothetical protein C5167_035070, partial [Papaver somniferum]